jgi:hypothetical protein
MKANWLMLLRVIIGVYFEKCLKHIQCVTAWLVSYCFVWLPQGL